MGRDNRILMLSLGMWALGEGLWYNLRPIYIEDLGATPAQVGLVMAIGGMARVAFLIPGGWLSDRYGPRKMLVASWVVGILAALALALAPDWHWIILGEFLYGASVFVLPALNSYALLALPVRQDAHSVERTLTTLYAAFPLGLIFSQPLGGLIADRYGIRTNIWIALFIFVVSTAVMFKISDHVQPREGTSQSWRALVRSRSFMTLVGFFFLVMLSMTLGWPLAPIFLHEVRGFSLTWIGVFAALFSVGTFAWNLSLGRLRPRWGLAAALGLVWLSMLLLLQSGAALVVGAAYLLMGAVFTTRSLVNAAVARRVTPAQRGIAFGMAEVGMSTGMTLSPRIAGTLYELRPELPFVASLASIPVAAVLSLIVLSVVRRRSATQALPRPGRLSV